MLLNAAGAIAAAGHAADLREGLELARTAIDSGAAGTRLDDLIAFSREGRVRVSHARCQAPVNHDPVSREESRARGRNFPVPGYGNESVT